MYKLYYSAGTCSMAVHVALIECNAAFELADCSLKDGKNREPEFLKLNPRGAVPVLLDDALVIREGGAILTYLCDKEKSALMPSSGAARATALEWLMWCNATLHPAYSRFFWLGRTVTDDTQKQTLQTVALANIQSLWDEAEARLAAHPYLAGNECTIADILLTVIANWLAGMVSFGPNVTRVLKAVSSRPAYQKALQAEGVEYKAAA
jgi:glutathione S-transferase